MSDRPTRKNLLVPLVVAAVAVVALLTPVASALLGEEDGVSGSPGASSAPDTAGPDGDPLARRRADDPMAKGDVDAPVVMIAYSEFQCPFCGKFARDTAPVLEEKYVEDGTLRIEWRDFPYLGPESMTAALAGRAAARQESFWEFHDAMYADQLPPNSGRLDQQYVEAIAEDLGLDLPDFRADMASAATKKLVTDDFAEGQALGVTGTPSFLVNGVPVVGAQPTAVFEQVIEEAAAE